MCSAGAALKINNGLKGDPAKQGEPTPCDETCRLTRKARMSKHGVQDNVTGFHALPALPQRHVGRAARA